MIHCVVDSTNYADESYRSEDAQKKVLWSFFTLCLSVCLSIFGSFSNILVFLDDADAGEIKKSHKSMRRRQHEAAKNQKKEELSKQRWQVHQSSVSSHSSGEEVFLG